MDAEKELKRALTSGNPDWIERAFSRYYKENVGIVYRVLIDQYGFNADTEDDVQDSFVALLRQPKRLLELNNITSYWLKSAKNICVNRRKRQSKVQELDEETPSGDKSIPELLLGKELFAKIEEWLGHPDADIVILRTAYCYSEREIAKHLGLGEDAISYRYHKGIKEIRRRIKDEKKRN